MAGLSGDATLVLDKLARLLDLEEAAVRQRSEEMFAGRTNRELEQHGVLLRKAKVHEVKNALFGRVRLVIGEDPQRPGHVDRFEVRPGGVVAILDKDEDGRPIKRGTGVVARRRRGLLEVVFDATSAEGAADADEAGIDLVRVEDDVTLRRMRTGLAHARQSEGRTARLLEIVLGTVKPKPTRRNDALALADDLNADQHIAAQHGILSEDVGLIHGPPGTGKTRVLVEVVARAVARGERVLALTASNAAIDHLALSVLQRHPRLSLARLGQPARVAEALEQHTLIALTEAHDHRRAAKELVDQAFQLLRTARRRSDRGREAFRREREVRAEAGKLFADARRLERQAAEDVLGRVRVLCGTLTSLVDDAVGDEPFDLLVIDEASQALTPAVLLGVLRARRVVLAGDHLQLPPTVISVEAARKGMADTVFGALCAKDADQLVSRMLTVQHRMNEELMAYPSARFYGDALVAHPTVAAHTLADLGVTDTAVSMTERVLDVIDTAGAGFDDVQSEGSESRENAGEAELVARVVLDLLGSGLAPADVGVIAPYAGQVALLSRLLAVHVDAGLEVDSVDGFQGREKEAIVFSAVRSNVEGEVGFLADPRRLNVAITRAKRKLVLVGDSATLSSDDNWRALFDHAIAAGRYRSAFELIVS